MKLLYEECIMILLLLLVGVMVQFLFYLIYLLHKTQTVSVYTAMQITEHTQLEATVVNVISFNIVIYIGHWFICCSKIIEKAIATQIHSHLMNNDIVDNFKSAYKTGHSCETALLRVYNYIVTTIGRGNGAILVLLDLSAAFDTIDHDNLFCILEKYVGICGNALKLIKSYFSNRTQRVQIDNVLLILFVVFLKAQF